MGFCDRLILARYSLEAVEASISGLYLAQLFQIPCMKIASTAQIFVGQYKGADKSNRIGPIVWQMIWFSIFSMILIPPISFPISNLFFQNTLIQKEGISYFRYLISITFLFPLGASLSSFYLGQGQAKKVLWMSLASHVIHILLDFPLIFGIKNILPSFGVKGAVISAAVAQIFFCSMLFWDFLKPLHRQVYNTAKYFFSWHSFWRCLQIGIPRAGTKMILLLAWVATTHIVLHKQENYLAVLAFGGTLNLFYTCFNEGMSQAVTTIGAYLIGAKQVILWKLARSASIFLMLMTALFAVPFLFFPESIIRFFFKESPSGLLNQELHFSCYWLWLLFMTNGFNLIFLGLLNSYGDTLFQMIFAATLGWMIPFFPVYFVIELNDGSPNRLWLIMAGACLVNALVYLLRFSQGKWKTTILGKEITPILTE